MTLLVSAPSSADTRDVELAGRRAALQLLLATGLAVGSAGALAQNYPITSRQRETAQRVSDAGVPLEELAPDAPGRYTVQRGDTLWAIARLYLRSPWRWPELWGMNWGDIRNPHRIYPGQVLVLGVADGKARLGFDSGGEPPTIKVAPRTRYEALGDAAIPTLPLHLIESFLVEAQIVREEDLLKAPRIVAAQEGRVLLSRGDRAYARSNHGVSDGGLSLDAGEPREFRVYRNAMAVKDPTTKELLGFEAQYVGKAKLVRAEKLRELGVQGGKQQLEIEPATLDIVSTKEEIRVGDRLLPLADRGHMAFVPRGPSEPMNGQIVSVYGNAVRFAGQNQVVLIDRGTEHGLEVGHVLQILKDGRVLMDKTDREQVMIRLPGERNGVMVVFRVFDRLSYALVLDITDGVKVGDRFTNP
jgi:LysM repeat protein